MKFIEELYSVSRSEFIDIQNGGFRILESLFVSDSVQLSIQASEGHYCTPRKTLPLGECTTMEVAIFKDDDFVSVGEVSDNLYLRETLEEFYDGTIYSRVPVEIIDYVVDELKAASV